MKLDDPAIKQRIMPALDRIGMTLLRCVVPLFQEFNGRPHQRGCGFLVHDGINHYLVSAAHVLREARERTLFLSLGGKRLRPLTDKGILTPAPGVAVSDDDVDIGVLLLKGNDLPPYPEIQKEPIPLSALVGNLRGDSQSWYLIVGYPASKGGRTELRTHLAFQPYSYTNIAAPLSTYCQVAADVSTHLVLTFNQKKAMGPHGSVQAFPHPYGMSGSPVWLLADGLPQIPVVAVATRWAKRDRVVVATDIASALSMIQHRFLGGDYGAVIVEGADSKSAK